MPKSCYRCEKYPMCSLHNRLNKVIQEEAVLDTSQFVFYSVAAHCKYYKEVIDED